MKRRMSGFRLWLLVAAATSLLGIHSCVLPDSDLEQCPSGLRCPPGWTCAAVQDICIDDGCGDGELDRVAGEECDDGNILPDDGCDPECLAEWVCGDGVREDPETCDDGNRLGGDGCPPSCGALPRCGDGKLDRGEMCDDGNHVLDDECPDGPEGTCQPAFCGDGFVWAGVEGCEEHVDSDGIPDDTQTCNANCQVPRCGDGHWNSMYTNPNTGLTEQCDPGEQDGPDCDADCTLPMCGDGYTNSLFINPQSGFVEECDVDVDGDGIADNTTECDADCTWAECGDGSHNPVNEQCDDGNTSNEDACLQGCVAASCGDGSVWAGVEECDDGNRSNMDGCPDNPDDSAMPGTCQRARCGDGHEWQGVEACDPMDPNLMGYCSPDCRSDGSCGNGYVDVALGEECDDGNRDNTDGCPDDPGDPDHPGECRWATCGDGHLWLGMEECDDDNDVVDDACPSGPGLPCNVWKCGDGYVNLPEEECDTNGRACAITTKNCDSDCKCR